MDSADHPPLLDRPDTETLRVFCPAKVNLALSVGAPRPDGLHPIASWMAPVGFGDTLTLRRNAPDAAEGACTIRFAEDAPLPQPIDWPAERDLACRALRAVESRVGEPLPVAVELQKRTPAGAGLGGGSADAAGMLDGLNHLLGLGLSEDVLLTIAGKLGSDVVFQLAARWRPGGAVVSGVGEQVTPLTNREPVPLLLALPGVHCATAEVYGAFDKAAGDDPPVADLARVQSLADESLKPDTALFNDLAPAACAVKPPVAEVMQALASAGHAPHVTGSGSTVFVVLEKADSATLGDLRRAAEEATGCATVLTYTAG